MNIKYPVATPFQFILTMLLGLLWSAHGSAQNLSVEDEIQNFIKIYENRNLEVSKVTAGQLEFSGITDTRLYDIIENRLLDEYLSKDSEPSAWLAKTLAYSGLSQYKATLTKVVNTTKSRKLKRHTKVALERLPKHTLWNADISSGTEGLTGNALYRQRTLNMINSDHSHLMMLGARRVWFHHPTDKGYVAAVKDKLLASYKSQALSDHDVDALAWLCNVLGKSEDPKYRQILLDIAASSPNRRVSKYAKKNAKLL